MFTTAPVLAAIDLGSNSFRLEVGQVLPSGYAPLLCCREMVSLGAGLGADGLLSSEAIERGLMCLAGFARDLAALRPRRIRVVATQTLREARNRDDFLGPAEALLGVPIELISGHEEGRLIYAGVSFHHPSTRRRLVIDIGGRSTELIVGQGRTPTAIASVAIGSGSLSRRHFPQGRLTAAGFAAARREAAQALAPVLHDFGPALWQEALASSGTAGTASSMLRHHRVGDGTLTADGLRWIVERCIAARHVERLALPGLKDRRRGVLPGGLAVLQALMDGCGIETLGCAKAALRHGVIVDLHETSLARAPAPSAPVAAGAALALQAC